MAQEPDHRHRPRDMAEDLSDEKRTWLDGLRIHITLGAAAPPASILAPALLSPAASTACARCHKSVYTRIRRARAWVEAQQVGQVGVGGVDGLVPRRGRSARLLY